MELNKLDPVHRERAHSDLAHRPFKTDPLDAELDDLILELSAIEPQEPEMPLEEIRGGGDSVDIGTAATAKLAPAGATKSASISGSSAPAIIALEDGPVEADDIYAEEYGFPLDALNESWPALNAMSVTELADALHELSFEMNGPDWAPYDEIRLKVCAISVELNRRGKLAPRFRGMRRPPYKVTTLAELDLSLDRQFIDLHWLHCTGWNRVIQGDRWKFNNVLKVKTFQPGKAEMFAKVPVSANEKATWLALPDHVAFQLAALQTDAIRERFRVANLGDTVKGKVRQVGRMQVTQLLETSVANFPQLQDQIPHWANIWMCARLVGDHANVLRQFHALAEGLEKPLDGRDIARRLTTVRSRLGESQTTEELVA